MMNLKIEYVSKDELKPYANNAKIHTAEQIEQIKKSIDEFGFNDPIAVWHENEVIEGHGRLLAVMEMDNITTVPIIRLDGLTDEQRKAYALVHNKLTMNTDFDMDILNIELEDIMDIDMSEFGMQLPSVNVEDIKDAILFGADDGEEEDDPDNRSAFQHSVFENQELRQYFDTNYYGIPEMHPTQTVGDKLLRFCDWSEVDDPENYIAHFYYDDFKFIQAWRSPDKYVERLRKFKAIVAPDFSLYTDFPRALQILSCYRRNWIGRYWQDLGLDVIPDVVWGDKESFNYCFLGIPKGGTVAVSTVGISKDNLWNGVEGELFMDGYNEMLNRIEPSTIIFYGDMIDGIEGNVIRCPSFYEQKRTMLNEKKEKKHGQG